MHWLLLFVFIFGILASVASNQATLAYLLFILLVADLLGGFVSKFISFLGGVANGLWETLGEEGKEVEAAKTKHPAGKKFIDEGLGRIGKELGNKEKEREEGLPMKSKLSAASIVGSIDNFLAGFGKLFRR